MRAHLPDMGAATFYLLNAHASAETIYIVRHTTLQSLLAAKRENEATENAAPSVARTDGISPRLPKSSKAMRRRSFPETHKNPKRQQVPGTRSRTLRGNKQSLGTLRLSRRPCYPKMRKTNSRVEDSSSQSMFYISANFFYKPPSCFYMILWEGYRRCKQGCQKKHARSTGR